MLACGVAAPGEPADPSAPRPVDAGLEERVGVYLVQLEILATDKQGEPIVDLRPEELVIRENGRPQSIERFERHARERLEGPAPDARILFDAPDGREPLQHRGASPRWIVLFFDLAHGDLQTRHKLEEAADAFVRSKLSEHDLVAVLSFAGEVRLEQNFTTNRELLQQAVRRAFSRDAYPVDWRARMSELLTLVKDCQAQMVPTKSFQHGRDCVAVAARSYIREAEPTTAAYLDALETLGRLLAGVQGRKYLMMFSHGVSLDPSREAVEAIEAVAGSSWQLQELRFELMEQVEYHRKFYGAIEKAIRGGVTVFTIDGSPQPTQDFDLQSRGRYRRNARPFATAFTAARDGLADLARNTGGRFFGGSDFLGDLDRALRATRGAYTLTYHSDIRRMKRPLEFVEIRVDCKRKGVVISSRDGFYFEPRTGTAHLGRLELAAAEPVGDKALVPFSLTLEPRNFDAVRTDVEAGLNFTLHLRLLTLDGFPLADSFHFLSHVFPRSAFDEGRIVAPRYEGRLELEPGEYVFTALIRDPQAFTHAELAETVRVPPAGSRPAD